MILGCLCEKSKCVCKYTRPKATDRHKVLNVIIRYHGPVVNIRNMVKNLWNITTHMVKGNKMSFLHTFHKNLILYFIFITKFENGNKRADEQRQSIAL